MKPLQHARITAHRYGGGWQDWIAIHDWIDQGKRLPNSSASSFLMWKQSGWHRRAQVDYSPVDMAARRDEQLTRGFLQSATRLNDARNRSR